MPRRIPGYLRHKTGQARVILNGQTVYLGAFGTPESLAQYDRVIGQWIAAGRKWPPTDKRDIEAESSSDPATATVADVLRDYNEYAREYYGPARDSHYTKVAPTLRDASRLYGSVLADQFGPLMLQSLRQYWVDSGSFTRTTINDKTKTIVRAFQWAVSVEKVPAHVFQALSSVPNLRRGRTSAREGKKRPPVADEIVEQTLPHLSEVLADMIRVQRLTGARPGEICQMRPMDIERRDDVWLYRPASHKTEHHGHERIVIIGPKAQRILGKYLLRDHRLACFSPMEAAEQVIARRASQRKTPASCGTTPTGSRDKRIRPYYDVQSYARAIKRACEKNGIPTWTPHQLRHTAATEIRKTFDIEAAQVALGHRSPQITEVYAERDLQKAIEVARRLG